MEIAVAICTRQRAAALSAALQSCVNQTVKPAEVIVIDDGALDDSFVQEWSARLAESHIRWMFRRKEGGRRGLTISRNQAWQGTRCDVIFYLDDDAQLAPDCLERLTHVFTADRDGAVVGVDFRICEMARAHAGRRLIERLYALAGLWSVLRRFHRRRRLPETLAGYPWLAPVAYLRGGAMAIRREALVRIGGFDDALSGHAMGEDKEVSIRLAARGVLARIVEPSVDHASESGGRQSPRDLGYETVRNYLYINTKAYRLGVGEVLMLGYTVCALFGIELAFACVGDRRRHFEQLAGMSAGLIDFARWMSWRNTQGV